MGKLLHRTESFNWTNKTINRSFDLQNYNIALITAREFEDDIYCPQSMYDLDNIFLFMWTNGQSFEQLLVHFNWLTADDFQVLLNLQYMMGSHSPNSSNSWADFSNEFIDENKSLIGLRDNSCTFPLIHDNESIKQFHSNYVASFDLDKQKANFKYFKKHYIPILKFTSTHLQNLITRNQVSNQIIRVDPPPTDPNGKPIHGQQFHVHFKIKSKVYALNLDGTWKHPPLKTSEEKIPNEICSALSQWGFCLPEEYY